MFAEVTCKIQNVKLFLEHKSVVFCRTQTCENIPEDIRHVRGF